MLCITLHMFCISYAIRLLIFNRDFKGFEKLLLLHLLVTKLRLLGLHWENVCFELLLLLLQLDLLLSYSLFCQLELSHLQFQSLIFWNSHPSSSLEFSIRQFRKILIKAVAVINHWLKLHNLRLAKDKVFVESLPFWIPYRKQGEIEGDICFSCPKQSNQVV